MFFKGVFPFSSVFVGCWASSSTIWQVEGGVFIIKLGSHEIHTKRIKEIPFPTISLSTVNIRLGEVLPLSQATTIPPNAPMVTVSFSLDQEQSSLIKLPR